LLRRFWRGESMSLVETVIFTIIGGLVAGLAGLIGTFTYMGEERKKEHLKEHKNNLEAVSKALDGVFGEIWPFIYGAEDLKLPKSPFGNERRVADIEIKKEPVKMELPNPFSDNHSAIQAGIDTVLYDDISPHFHTLFESLHKTDQEAKNNGVKMLKLLNSFSDLIYKNLNFCEIDFPYQNGNKNEFKKFRDLSHEIYEQEYAGTVFLMAIGEDEGSWPDKARWLKNNNVYDDLKKLANEIKDDNGEMLKQLLEMHKRLLNYIEECKEEIKRIEHTTKLKGKCPYL
jgi:hypothetical protein